MNIHYKDGKIYVTADNARELTTVVGTVVDENRTDYEFRLIPIVLTTTDGEFTNLELEFIQKFS